MKHYRLFVFATLVALGTVTAANAQQPAGRPAAPAGGGATAQPQAGAASGMNGMAVINTAYFTDEKEGISRLVGVARGVEREFQQRRTELEQLNQRRTALLTELENLSKSAAPVSPQTVTGKQEQVAQLERDIKRKGEDAQLAYNKRASEALAPIYDDIAKALETYARQRNISLILDEAKLESAMFVVTRGSLDITRDFIADYNRRNPATASAAPAR